MTASNPKKLTIDELMSRIRAKVMQRRGESDLVFKTDPVLVEDVANHFSLPRLAKTEKIATKASYTISDFTNYHDEAFIHNAYLGVLKRLPDRLGGDIYLKKLRSGTLSKIEILGRLRYSPEGRIRRVKIRGLLPVFISKLINKLPVLGYFTSLITALVSLPKIMRNQQKFENYTDYHFNKFTAIINQTAEQVEAAINKLTTESKTMADQFRVELEPIKDIRLMVKDLDERLARVIDVHELSCKTQQTLLARVNNLENELISQRKLLTSLYHEEQLEETQFAEFYAGFEDKFRGTRQDIKERQKVYLSYIEKAKVGHADSPIIDIGSGRGEWLELLTEHDLFAKGIDINQTFINYCQAQGLFVEKADALAYLSVLEDNSVGAITGFHIIEHLPLKTLVKLLIQCHRVLKPGGLIIFETPNPENLMTGACNFYLDPTHRNPIPPAAAAYLIEARGFGQLEVLKLNKSYSEDAEKIDNPYLKQLLFGEQDYGIVAHKLPLI